MYDQSPFLWNNKLVKLLFAEMRKGLTDEKVSLMSWVPEIELG